VNECTGVYYVRQECVPADAAGWLFLTRLAPDLVAAPSPPASERLIGQAAAAQLLAGEQTIDAGPAADAVRAITARLVAAIEANPGYGFDVRLVKSDLVNAAALPGGTLVVYSGLLAEAGSADEVAGVMAHGRHRARAHPSQGPRQPAVASRRSAPHRVDSLSKNPFKPLRGHEDSLTRPGVRETRDLERLEAVLDFAADRSCLTQRLLEYFGEQVGSAEGADPPTTGDVVLPTNVPSLQALIAESRPLPRGLRRNRAAVGIDLARDEFGLDLVPHRGAHVMLEPFGRRMEVVDRQFGMPAEPGLPEPVRPHHHLRLAAAVVRESHAAVLQVCGSPT